MSSYNELIKNFERIRAYMRDFYVYGFKSREEYDKKSARSYDDERRRIESWLGEYMGFIRTPEGKSVFLSIDSRVTDRNPLYKAWKAKSFTDGDITLHFILFDILHDPSVSLSLPEILSRIDADYLSRFDAPMIFDESTVRKKLQEYVGEGIIVGERQGRRMMYRRSDSFLLPDAHDALCFFSETAPCGVLGSFLLDKQERDDSVFGFKHHYITGTLDSDVLATLFSAIRSKREVTLSNLSRYAEERREFTLIPLRIFASVQTGRQHLMAFDRSIGRFRSFRLDYISNVRTGEPCTKFDVYLERLTSMQKHMWGVNCHESEDRPEHVEFTVYVGNGEDYIIDRLEREKRCGRIERLDAHHYRFTADVFNSQETIPWIRTFICRITSMNFSNRTVENIFKRDIEAMYAMYGLEGGDAP